MKALWIGGTRYSNPLEQTAERKWNALTELGIGMTVIGFANGIRPRRFRQHADFYLLPRLPLPVLRYLTLFTLAPVLAVWVILRHGINVIVAQSPYEGAAAALAKTAARVLGRNVSLIVESHGNFEEDIFSQRRITLKGLYKWVMNRFAAYAFRHADAFRVISSSTRQQIDRWVSGKPVVQFMTWTDEASFVQKARTIPVTETRDIVYAGVLIPRKGVHFLLEAFQTVSAETPGSHLWLVGRPDDPEYAAQLRQTIQQHQLDGRVTFVGGVSQSELADYFGRARVAVLPSTSEGLGRVVVEAMMCGTPVIGSAVGGIPDMIQDGENGFLVPAGDVLALTEALHKILRDEVDVMGMSQNATRFAQAFFSPTLYVDGYRRLFEVIR